MPQRQLTLQSEAAALGHRIATLRAGLGLTQEAFAERAGFSTRYLQSVEGGKENLTLESLVKFANLFQVRLADLFIASRGLTPRRRVGVKARGG